MSCFHLLSIDGCVAWRGVAWCGVAWRGVSWRFVAWRGVAWRGVAAKIFSGFPRYILAILLKTSSFPFCLASIDIGNDTPPPPPRSRDEIARVSINCIRIVFRWLYLSL